ncbi:MAG: divalent-cation tolerance protein CutA [Candidatus Krumholzibacteriia bacterium]
MTRELHVVMTSLETADQAAELARTLLAERLAVCVQIGDPVRSFYRWQGALADTPEVPLLLKVRHDRLARCLDRLAELHPYDTPEILAWPVPLAAARYLDWAYSEDDA